MVIVELKYLKPIEEVEKYLEAHRAFLDKYYAENVLIASGPKNPRDGGIIVGVVNKEQIQSIIEQDPFYIHKIAKYDVTEFLPVKHHKNIAELL